MQFLVERGATTDWNWKEEVAKGCPERPAFDVGELNPYGVERDLIDFEHGAVGIEMPDELDHGVERDSRYLLPIAIASIAGQELGARTLARVSALDGAFVI